MSKLTHLDEAGHAHMVDVSGKSDTDRMATATAIVQLTPAAMAILLEGNLKKGDALAVARIAGIMAAKKTSELIPLCHPLPITKVAVDLETDRATHRILITATVKTRGQTGVEMEALTSASTAALTVYDMMKAVDKGITIASIQLEEKQGGKSGTWRRSAL
ncbi:cyclic pyranopterin monophosphate synthase MoaC [Planktomarina temperata]|jgi:cyclic pyranopterin phosphate synthase|uniref:cyclic pyranopterin monophosphate synthase MoaC n=1 Tax=Planktomarina TaxID=1284657 RepID=UPI0023040AFE|nr:cyclic pyranopterin monophosphate synthase MoaC [Planktomarina temperata]MDA7455280.1 cyclic pyranopterin monophosphate synthase MoaC [Planktomarina temperata]MDA7475000.1 cyclic pyranopterin monophosphate synthase MoaC [Planktomarina temperata]MDA8525624.1 cyclic pyranopterin monophosphate synthase MoaC [Planktomarina temperata]MDA8713117.1 cyclic pyranopterin monophosphate synthase MoaC [Planktomarina temperata]